MNEVRKITTLEKATMRSDLRGSRGIFDFTVFHDEKVKGRRKCYAETGNQQI